MPFKLMGQRIDMLPLSGGFVESGLGGEMSGDEIDLLALQDCKRLCPDVPEGGALGDAVIRKELQHVSCLVQVLVALCAVFIHPLLGRAFGRIRKASDVMNQSGQQVVMELLIPMGHEA